MIFVHPHIPSLRFLSKYLRASIREVLTDEVGYEGRSKETKPYRKHFGEGANTEAPRQVWTCFVQGLARRPAWRRPGERGREPWGWSPGGGKERGHARH